LHAPLYRSITCAFNCRTREAFVDGETAVEVGVVDVTLPTNGGAGFLKIGAHDDEQVSVHGVVSQLADP